jgi:hypothetical protein
MKGQPVATQLDVVQGLQGGALGLDGLHELHDALWSNPKMCGMQHRKKNLLNDNLLDKEKI